MDHSNVYEDEFTAQFTNEKDFLDFLRQREQNGGWETKKASKLQLVALEEGSVITDLLRDNFAMTGLKDVLRDTLDNTKLMLHFADQYYPVRSCAIKTILDRARINGKSLSKVSKEDMAKILNVCMATASGDALLRIADGKVSAVHGGDNCDYAVLEMPSLFQRTANYLRQHFKQLVFGGGNFEHALTSALWVMDGADNLTESYRKTLAAHGYSNNDVQAALRLVSSDVGISGANIYPMLALKSGVVLPLGHALKLEHKNGADLSDFNNLLAMTFSQYEAALRGLEDLLDIEVRYPINTLLGVMKKIGINKRLAYEIADLYKAQYGEDEATAHDLYYSIAEAPYLMQCDGASASRITQAEEDAARALSINWANYDIPGTIAW